MPSTRAFSICSSRVGGQRAPRAPCARCRRPRAPPRRPPRATCRVPSAEVTMDWPSKTRLSFAPDRVHVHDGDPRCLADPREQGQPRARACPRGTARRRGRGAGSPRRRAAPSRGPRGSAARARARPPTRCPRRSRCRFAPRRRRRCARSRRGLEVARLVEHVVGRQQGLGLRVQDPAVGEERRRVDEPPCRAGPGSCPRSRRPSRCRQGPRCCSSRRAFRFASTNSRHTPAGPWAGSRRGTARGTRRGRSPPPGPAPRTASTFAQLPSKSPMVGLI